MQADELRNENRMLFGDTDAQGLACDISISLETLPLLPPCYVQRSDNARLSWSGRKKMVEEEQVSSGLSVKLWRTWISS